MSWPGFTVMRLPRGELAYDQEGRKGDAITIFFLRGRYFNARENFNIQIFCQ